MSDDSSFPHRLSTRVRAQVRRRPWTVPMFVAVAPFVVLAPAMFGGLLAIEDGWLQYFPMRAIASEQLLEGRFPAWTPVQFSGSGIHELGHTAVLYPLNVLLAPLPADLAYNLGLAAALSVGSLGAYLLAARISGSRVGGLVAAVGYGYAPFVVSELSHPDMLTSLAWIPWALLGIEIAGDPGRRAKGVALTAVATALAVLGGHQQMVSACIIAVLGWGIGTAILARDRRAGRAVDAIAALALGALLSGVQLLPSLVAAGDSGRASYSYAEASSFTLELRQLPLLLFPYASGSPHSGDLPVQMAVGFPQLGVALLVLAVGAIPSWRRDRRIVLAGVLAVLVLGVSLSPLVEPVGRLVHQVPLFGLFRGWSRFLLVSQLMFALLAAITVARLRSEPPAGRRVLARWCGAAAVVYVVAAVGLQLLPLLPRRTTAGLVVPAVLALVAAGLVVLGGRRAGIASLLLVGCITVQVLLLAPHRPWDVPTVPAETVAEAFDTSNSGRFVAAAPDGPDRYLFLGSYPDEPTDDLVPRAPLTGLTGALSANGYSPLARQAYLDAVGMDFYGNTDPSCLLGGPSSEAVLDLLRITTLVAAVEGEARSDLERRGPTEPVGADHVRSDRTPGLPGAWLASGGAVDQLSSAASGEVACAPGLDLGTVVPAEVGRWDERSIRVSTDHPDEALLVVSVADGPGWTATVDGEPADVEDVLGLVVGIRLPPGEHDVELVYAAPRLAQGAVLSVVGAVGLAGVLAAPRLLRRRRRRAVR